MNIKVITAPATEPLTLTEAKAYLRVDGTADDTVITALITAAREYCEDYQNKKYITQTLELILDDFPDGDSIDFRDCSPIQSVTSLKYYDTDSVEYTMSASDYYVDITSSVARVVLGYSKTWPTEILRPANAIVVRFVAGYGAATAVPESTKQAMVLHLKLLYDDYKPDERERLEKARNTLLSMRARVAL